MTSIILTAQVMGRCLCSHIPVVEPEVPLWFAVFGIIGGLASMMILGWLGAAIYHKLKF